MKEVKPCICNPDNIGIDCPTQGALFDLRTKEWIAGEECKKCGWNPEVAKIRHEQILEKFNK